MLVMKFGGTSVGSGERMLNVAHIVRAHLDQQPVVMTSAMSGITDALLALADAAAQGEAAACEMHLAALVTRHFDAAETISAGADWSSLHLKLDALRSAVKDTLEQHGGSQQATDAIVSWGERLAVALVAGALEALGQPALAWDTPVIAVDERHARPLAEETRQAAEAALAQAGSAVLVTPGFIGQTASGRITTLGRGGSDYSATLLAVALGANACWIYTDVDGVFSADPRIVSEASILPTVSYRTAGRLSCSGAKVLHPQSVAPAARQGIPLRVRNTFRPEHLGTLIAPLPKEGRGAPQAVAGRKKLCAISPVGDGLPEVANLFGRMCHALTRIGAEIVLSAHPVPIYDSQVIIDAGHMQAAVEELEREFADERAQGQVQSIRTIEGLALCALVGEELSGTVMTQAQRALAIEGIVPLVQTACSSALSFIIQGEELEPAIRSIHQIVIEPAQRQSIHHSLGLDGRRAGDEDGQQHYAQLRV